MTKTVCKLNSVQVGTPSAAFALLPRALGMAFITLSLGLVSCSSPRTPAPIVDRSSKVPPVVIVSSVGQSKPAVAPASPASSTNPTPRPIEAGPMAQPSRDLSKPATEAQGPAASAKPIRNPQIVSSARPDASNPSPDVATPRTDMPRTDAPAMRPDTGAKAERSNKADVAKKTESPQKNESAPRTSQAQQTTEAKPSSTQEPKSIDARRDEQKANAESKASNVANDVKDQESPGALKPPASADIEWIWPADGKWVSTFSGGKGGIRIEGQSGDPILAIGDGKVIFAGQGPKGYGNLLIVRHEGELLSVYAHNRALLVQEGSQVKKGQKIAEMGDSGADRTQLGFELRRNGRPVDPRSALPQR
ncbi:MAG: hypothetical protein EBT36_00320 [Betaproteobacteria bacterium]|jgi:lipoprotein NlpD|nr:peptidoglycan DD-metalloendopeptidase family protein [Pseudomonadota bacterium]NBO02674.1 hypothetical protein [Betaproteobacteria bacterium]HAB48522.1 hypothetical protein [Lautropia sp.]NBP33967.1 hypothetical protein [Betaproteobacteria bacterium]NBP37246.1 hypothetical protein [Betaproteobacteria bacterium]